MGAHGQDGAVGGRNLRAADAHDDVALLDAGLVGGAAVGDLGHVGALAHGELVGLGVLGVDGLHGEADVGVGDLLAVHDLLRHVDGVVAWDGKANAGKALGVRGVERADAHKLAAVVDKRAAGVAGVDGRIHLDEVGVERVARAGLHELVARQGRDDALRDGLLEAKRAAHGHDPVAHLQGGGVAHLDGRDGVSLEVRLDHGEVAGGVRAHELGVVALAVDGHGNAVGVLDDVVVGDDVAFGVKHHAGAQALAGIIGAGDRDHGRQGLGGHRRGGGGVVVGRVDGDGLVGARGEGGSRPADDARAQKHARQRSRAHNAASHAQERGPDAGVVATGFLGDVRPGRGIAGSRVGRALGLGLVPSGLLGRHAGAAKLLGHGRPLLRGLLAALVRLLGHAVVLLVHGEYLSLARARRGVWRFVSMNECTPLARGVSRQRTMPRRRHDPFCFLKKAASPWETASG